MKRIFRLIIATSVIPSFLIPSFVIPSFAIPNLTDPVAANENIPTVPIPAEVDKIPYFESKSSESNISGSNSSGSKSSGSKSFDYENFDFWVEQCQTLDNLQKYTEALVACEKAIALKPKKKNIELWTARSNALLNLGNYSEALTSYKQVLQKEPNHSSALTQQCYALFALGKNQDAILSCEEALKVNGHWGNITPATAWYNRGLALKKLARYSEAITSFERATLIKPDYSLAFAQICGVFVNLKLYQKAIKACDTGIQKNGDWGKATAALAWKNKAVALTKLGKLIEPIYAYTRSLEVNSQDAIAWYEQGKLLQKLRQYDRALASYSMAVKLKPKYSQAFARQAEILNKLQNYDSALKMSDMALAGDGIWSQDTTLAYLWYQRSTALVNLKKYEESAADAERAITLKPDYAEAWNNNAVSLWNLGKYLEAEQASLKAIKFNPKYAQAWFNRGRILSSLRRYPEAIKAYKQALKGDIEQDSNFTHASIWTNQGVAHWRLGKHILALNSFDKAIKINRKSFAAWYNKGVVLIEIQKKYRANSKNNLYLQALNAYQQANRINPNNSAVLTGEAIARFRLGQYQKALIKFDNALNLNPDNIVAQQEREKLLGVMQYQLNN